MLLTSRQFASVLGGGVVGAAFAAGALAAGALEAGGLVAVCDVWAKAKVEAAMSSPATG